MGWGLRICLKMKQTRITYYQTGDFLANFFNSLTFFLQIACIRTLLAINQCQKSWHILILEFKPHFLSSLLTLILGILAIPLSLNVNVTHLNLGLNLRAVVMKQSEQ